MDPISQYTITLDDDPMISRMIEVAMGLKSLSFSSGATFLTRAQRYQPLAIFVDIHLGTGDSGLDLIPQIRTRWPYCPVLVVTSDPSDEAVGQALAAGANDFIRKPIIAKELIARFQARTIEMAERQGRSVVTIGDVTIDVPLNLISGISVRRHLSTADIRLFVALVEARGTVISKEDLKRKIWGDLKVSDNAMDKKIYEVRQALSDVSKAVKIKSEYGQGIKILVIQEEDRNVA